MNRYPACFVYINISVISHQRLNRMGLVGSLNRMGLVGSLNRMGLVVKSSTGHGTGRWKISEVFESKNLSL